MAVLGGYNTFNAPQAHESALTCTKDYEVLGGTTSGQAVVILLVF